MHQISAVPAFRDNYIWVIHQDQGAERMAVLVDPGEPEAILAWLAAEHTRPVAVLITHRHSDHTGALPTLAQRWGMPVYGPRRENIPGVTHPVGEGDTLDIPELDLHFQVLETPGHTLGHVCYLGHGLLFSGDTLFSCGCGRVFEGTHAQMFASLHRLAQLPDETQVYCAHEYTLPNIGFAKEVEENNPALAQRHFQARQLRKAGKPTLPSSIAQERATNPFLRCHLPEVRMAIAQQLGIPLETSEEAFSALREWKDRY